MNGKEILVTGGAGFIGHHLTERFREANSVHILDIDDSVITPAGVTNVTGDVRAKDIVDRTTANTDVVFHEAALVSVTESINDPRKSHTTNATGTLNILEAARKHNTRVIFSSSAAIYGYPKYVPIDEEHPTIPTSPYGVDKLTADQYTRLYADLYDLDTVALRYFNVYGPGQTGEYAGVITIFIKQALNDEPITVHGDGSQTRDFVFVEDIIQANQLAATTDNTGQAYNIGTGESITIRELAELIQELTDSDADIVHTEPRDGDIEQSEADISRARSNLGYEPTTSLRDGLEQTINWFENQS